MAAYAQPSGKRQKVREGRSADNVDYFQGIDKLEYNNMCPAQESNCYRYYNPGERIHSRTMEEWIKCSLSLTEFRERAYDSWSKPSHRSWEEAPSSLDNYKRCLKAFFDLCSKMNVRYYTAFDSDLLPWTEWEEYKSNFDDIADYIQEFGQKCHVKLLWLAPDLHSNAKYSSGAMTSNETSTYLQACCQIKKCLEISHKLNAECFPIWPHREGYDVIIQTDVAREMKLMSKLLKMTVEYRDKIGYRCQLVIMPYTGNTESLYDKSWQHYEDVVYKYMWDVTSCLYFLRTHNLERYFKVCTPPGHHMYMANVYNMLGGVTITNQFNNYNNKTIALMMKYIIDQGAPLPAGINIRLSLRRDFDTKDIIAMYTKYLDCIAKGTRIASGLITEQLFNKHIQQRYASYQTGPGARLSAGDLTLEECEEFYKKIQAHPAEASNRSQNTDLVFQRYIDTCEHL